MQGINPMGISAPWADYKNNLFIIKLKTKKQPYDITQKNCKRLTQWALFNFVTTIETKNYSQT